MVRGPIPTPDARSLGIAPRVLAALRPAFERARDAGLPTAVLAIELAGLDAARRVRGEEAARAALEALGAWLEARLDGAVSASLVTERGALVCTAGPERESAEALAQELVLAARRLPLASGILLPLAPAVGLAWTGTEPRPLELLLLVAQDGVEVAGAGTGFAHSELYELLERRVAREAPECLEREREREVRRQAAKSAAPGSPALKAVTPARPTTMKQVVLSGEIGREIGERLAHAVEEERAKDPSASAEEIEARVLRRADSWLHEMLSHALSEQATGHREQVGVLERRLAKLDKALKETESALRRLAQAKSYDPGLASIYREVQGLRGEEDAYALKLSMMQQILEANLELHARIAMR